MLSRSFRLFPFFSFLLLLFLHSLRSTDIQWEYRQHFSKRLLKDFRDRHGSPATPKKEEADTGESKGSSPSPTAKAVTAPSSRKRAPKMKKAPASKEVAAPDDDDDDLGNAGDVPGLASPAKKIKLEEEIGDHKEMEEVEGEI